jgi:uncharacterized protein (TIGR02466 family)
MSQYDLIGLFPTPLYHTRLDREFSPLEKSFVEKEAEEPENNIGNMIGKGMHVLSDPAMTDIRMFIERHIRIFMKEVYAPASPVYAYITQSWLNYTYPGQAHHAHMHDNSFLSGVLYINAHEDAITFISGRGHSIRLTTDNYNPFNSDTWKVPVESGDLIIFPSRLVHMVESTPTDRTMTRVSLAFNTFLRGEIGDPKERIHLVLR